MSGDTRFDVNASDWFGGTFAEATTTIGALSATTGARVDRFVRARATTVDPPLNVRVALGRLRALKISATGLYHQAPASSYYDRVRGVSILPPMQAVHYVACYEAGRETEGFYLRAEGSPGELSPPPAGGCGFRAIWPMHPVRRAASICSANGSPACLSCAPARARFGHGDAGVRPVSETDTDAVAPGSGFRDSVVGPVHRQRGDPSRHRCRGLVALRGWPAAYADRRWPRERRSLRAGIRADQPERYPRYERLDCR